MQNSMSDCEDEYDIDEEFSEESPALYEEDFDSSGEGPAPMQPPPPPAAAPRRVPPKTIQHKSRKVTVKSKPKAYRKPNPSDPKLVSECVKLELGHVHLVLGRTGSGKTHLIRELAHSNLQSFNRIFVICPTTVKGKDGSYGWLDSKNVFCEDVTEELLDSIIESQCHKANKKTKMLLILDDCIPAVNMKSKVFKKLATQSRHLGGGITTLIALQHLKYCPPICRDNALAHFILKLGANNQNAAFELQQRYDNKRDWTAFLDRSTRDYQIVRSDDDLRVFKLPAQRKRIFIKTRD